KEGMPLWYIPSRRFFKADAETALIQINEVLEKERLDATKIEHRRNEITNYTLQQKREQEKAEQCPEEMLTPEYVLACIRGIVDDNTIVTNELISSYQASYTHLNMTNPGSIFGSGA